MTDLFLLVAAIAAIMILISYLAKITGNINNRRTGVNGTGKNNMDAMTLKKIVNGSKITLRHFDVNIYGLHQGNNINLCSNVVNTIVWEIIVTAPELDDGRRGITSFLNKHVDINKLKNDVVEIIVDIIYIINNDGEEAIRMNIIIDANVLSKILYPKRRYNGLRLGIINAIQKSIQHCN
ncbi:hypothetical protein [Microcystis phage Mel-JY01]